MCQLVRSKQGRAAGHPRQAWKAIGGFAFTMALGRIETRPLFAIKLTVAPLQELGGDAARGRRVAVATGHR